MFQIDFFELCFLAEVCVPPKPIARMTFWEKLINIHYHNMTNEQRARFYEIIKKRIDEGYDHDNKDIQKLLARYNPDNQYEYMDMALFLYDGEFYRYCDTTLSEEYKPFVNKLSADVKLQEE